MLLKFLIENLTIDKKSLHVAIFVKKVILSTTIED